MNITHSIRDSLKSHQMVTLNSRHVTENEYNCLVAKYRTLTDEYVCQLTLNEIELSTMCDDEAIGESTFSLLSDLHDAGFDYVLFDADGPKVEGLPLYDW